MSTNRPLPERIAAQFTELSPKQQKVARLLAEESSYIALASAADVATRTGVDIATVVRTCQRLGYSGWRELLSEVKGDLGRRQTFAERVAQLGSDDGDLTSRIFANARQNLDQTQQGLDTATFEAAAGALSAAGAVVVAADGVSAGVGEFLTSSLQIIGVRATLTTGVGNAAPALASLVDGDVVVGVSMWRYLRSTVETMAHAKSSVRATLVALTDSPVSPAAQLADHTLVARTDTIGPRMSMTGVTTLIEALVARTALHDPVRSQTATARASAFYFDSHVLGEPSAGTAEDGSWDHLLAREINGD